MSRKRTWMCVLVLVVVVMIVPVSGRASDQEPVALTPAQARQAAQERLRIQVETGNAPSWSSANVNGSITLYDLSSEVSAYLFPVSRQGEPAGYLTVAAVSIPNPVLEFATEGASPLLGLSDIREWASAHGYELFSERPLYLGLLSYAYELTPTERNRRIVDLASRVISEVSPTQASIPMRKMIPTEPMEQMVVPQAYNLINGVPDWNQFWGGYGCWSGCSPTSGVNVMGYWDGHGYNNLIYGGDWQGAVNEMRTHMNTFCDGSNGATYIQDISPGMVAYAQTHGYHFESLLWCSGCPTEPTYVNYRAQIDANHPMVVDVINHSVYGDHSVAGVGYDTNGSYMIVHDNWDSTGENVYLQFGSGYSSIWMHPVAPDLTAPITAYSLSGTSGDDGWWISDVQVTLSADEAVQWTKYRIDGSAWSTYETPFVMRCDGIHALQYYSKDLAGNEESIRSTTVKISQTAPAPSPTELFYSKWTAWSPSQSAFAVDHCRPLGVGDVNGDGYDDLVCPYDYGSSTTKTFVQTSSGRDLSSWTGWSPRNDGGFDLNRCKPLHIGDVNGDGYDDLVCPYDYGSSTTKTLAQISSGSDLSAWTGWSPRNDGGFDLNRCTPLHLGDVNGDGYDDLVCPYDYGSDTTKTFVQISSGSDLSAWTGWSPLNDGGFDLNQCKPVHLGDVNGDGLDDLICPYDYGESTTQTLVQISSGQDLSAWTQWSTRNQGGFALDRCKPLHIGDVNGDGRADLACVYDYGNCKQQTWVQLAPETGLTSWSAWSTRSESLSAEACSPLLIGDANGDGQDDLLCAYDYGSNTTMTFIQVSRGSSSNPWATWSRRNEGGFALSQCASVQIADLQGDRHCDMVCPYDYGDSKTTTWAQVTARFSTYVPLSAR